MVLPEEYELPIRSKYAVDYGVLRIKHIEIRNAHIAADILRNYIGKKGCEHLVAVTLDRFFKPMDILPVGVGDEKQVDADAQIILEEIIHANKEKDPEKRAVVYVLAHNHPGRSLAPSDYDIALYKELFIMSHQSRLVEFGDGIIIADGTKQYYSFKNDPLYKAWPDYWRSDYKLLREKHLKE